MDVPGARTVASRRFGPPLPYRGPALPGTALATYSSTHRLFSSGPFLLIEFAMAFSRPARSPPSPALGDEEIRSVAGNPHVTRRFADMTDHQLQEQAVAGAWARIEKWLKQHAPRTYRMLPVPAPEADIREVEQELDLTVPPGLKAFYRLRNGTGHPGDFGWTTEPGTGLRPQAQGTAWLLPRQHGIPPVQHLPYWDEGPHTIGMPNDPMVRYLAFAATDRSGLYGLFTDCTPGPGYGRIGTFEEAGIPRLGVWPSFADYLIEVADALDENRGVEDADAHQDTKVPGLVDHALVWDGPAHPREPGWTRFA
ncbi:SMI1/KNR4 family protein [Streptomyces sp. NPDC059696]|uniref:SMI1/KNR4 family protein n=1 Tax=Streptomyces sp. NPDC059696 TaxID=3346911 RepID=UPI0036A994DF